MTFAVAFFAIAFAGLAVSIGVAIGYFFAKNQMELFFQSLYIIALVDPAIIILYMLIIGLVRPLTLKSLRPINENIIGENWSFDISLEQLSVSLSALQKFPMLNAVIGGILALIPSAILFANAYFKDYESIILLSLVVTCIVTTFIYTFLIFSFTHHIITPLRIQGNRLSWQLRKRNQAVKRL